MHNIQVFKTYVLDSESLSVCSTSTLCLSVGKKDASFVARNEIPPFCFLLEVFFFLFFKLRIF